MKRILTFLFLLTISSILIAEEKVYKAEIISHFEQSSSKEEGLYYNGTDSYWGYNFICSFTENEDLLILDSQNRYFYQYDLLEGIQGVHKINERVAITASIMNTSNEGIEVYSNTLPDYYRFSDNYELEVNCQLDALEGKFGINYDTELKALCYSENIVFLWMENGAFLSIQDPGSNYEENNGNVLGTNDTRALFNAGTEFSSNDYELVGDDYLLRNGELVTNSYNQYIHFQKYLEPDFSHLIGHQYRFFNPDYTNFLFLGKDLDGNVYYYGDLNKFLIFSKENLCIERFSIEYESSHSAPFIDDTGNIYWMEYTPYTEGTGELTRGPSNSRPEIVGVDYYIKKITRTWALPEPGQTLGE